MRIPGLRIPRASALGAPRPLTGAEGLQLPPRLHADGVCLSPNAVLGEVDCR